MNKLVRKRCAKLILCGILLNIYIPMMESSRAPRKYNRGTDKHLTTKKRSPEKETKLKAGVNPSDLM